MILFVMGYIFVFVHLKDASAMGNTYFDSVTGQ